MYLAGSQINQIGVIFYLQKHFSIKDQLTKSNPKKKRSEKGLPSCQLGLSKFLDLAKIGPTLVSLTKLPLSLVTLLPSV